MGTSATARRDDSPLRLFVDGTQRRARFSVTPASPAPLPWIEGLLAGAAEVDITPPPGMPKAGLLGQRPRRQRVPHPAAGAGAPPAGGRRVGGARAVRPARRLGRRAAPRRRRRSPSTPTCRSPGCSSVPPTPTPGRASTSAPTSTTGSRRTGRASIRRSPSSSSSSIAGAVIEAVDDRGGRPGWPSAPTDVWGLHPQPLARRARAQRDRRRRPRIDRPSASSIAINPALHLIRVDADRAHRSRRSGRPRRDGRWPPWSCSRCTAPACRCGPRVQRRHLGLPRRRARCIASRPTPGTGRSSVRSRAPTPTWRRPSARVGPVTSRRRASGGPSGAEAAELYACARATSSPTTSMLGAGVPRGRPRCATR